ncbi:MAG TPA: site-specific integrase [Hanamia sp.]|nr:site-specific integrase [Hanamia sp.]
MAIKVKLRTKPISGNRQSLYLDFYPAISHPETGELTRREFLNLFLKDEIEHQTLHYIDGNGKTQKKIVPIMDKKGQAKKAKLTQIDKQHNKETLSLAEQIRQKRDNELNKPEIYTGYEKERLKIKENGEKDFVEYFLKLADKRKASNYDNWVSASHYLKKFTNGKLKFSDLNETFCNDFKEFLLSTPTNKSSKIKLSQNSVVSYFNKFKAAIRQAYKDGYLHTDLNGKIDGVKQAETRRNFLTIDELNILVKTDCPIPVLKQAALFSALTGLRFVDIQKMVWGEIEFIKGNGYFLKFKQQKTDGVEMLPISEQAFQLLGERKEPSVKVFEGLKYSAWLNQQLTKWLYKAGITKEITFHCFRHTYATLQLSMGTDIYTVSKMLGHRDLKTTQVYAKIISQTKRDAANKIHLDI